MTGFRVTPNVSASQILADLARHSARVSSLERQAATGLRISRPSDDPRGVRTVVLKQTSVQKLEATLGKISVARNRLNEAHVLIREAEQMFVRAKELALQAPQATDPQELDALATELPALLSRLESIANARSEEGFLFSGLTFERQPFATEDGTAVYQGSSASASIKTIEANPTKVLYSGTDVFQPLARQQTVFVGTTGAAAGTGTDNGIGQGQLVVRHTMTQYAAGSGVTAGVDSAPADTVVGPAGAHVLTIIDTSGTGSLGTVSLNGGDTVDFTSADTNLRVTGPNGAVVYIDTTNITPGFSGDVDITAAGTLSTDGGLTEVPVDFSANQMVIDSRDGTVTNVDSTGIRRSGVEFLEYTGTADAFSVLEDLRQEILNTRGLAGADSQEALGRRIEDVDRMLDHFLGVIGEQSVALANLDALQQHTEDVKLEAERQLADTANADIAQVAIELEQARSQVQFTLATASQLFELSLLDFL